MITKTFVRRAEVGTRSFMIMKYLFGQ